MLFIILFAFSKNDFVAQVRLFVEVLLVQSGRVLSVPILQLCLRSEQLMATLQAADHVLLQPQVKVEGEVEPGGLANLPRHAAQAGDPGGG